MKQALLLNAVDKPFSSKYGIYSKLKHSRTTPNKLSYSFFFENPSNPSTYLKTQVQKQLKIPPPHPSIAKPSILFLILKQQQHHHHHHHHQTGKSSPPKPVE
jgi:hypothetical protein